MKKLLIFMLVLGLVSVANATIVFDLTGSPAPGLDITLDFITTAGEEVSFVMLALVTDNGAGGSTTPGSWSSGFTLATDPGYNGAGFGYADGDLLGASGEADAGDSATGTLYSYTYTVSSSAVVGSVINFTVEDVPEYGMVSNIVLLSGAELTPGGFDVTVVPEPMTVLLLGLGGLFLRRRKGRS